MVQYHIKLSNLQYSITLTAFASQYGFMSSTVYDHDCKVQCSVYVYFSVNNLTNVDFWYGIIYIYMLFTEIV